MRRSVSISKSRGHLTEVEQVIPFNSKITKEKNEIKAGFSRVHVLEESLLDGFVAENKVYGVSNLLIILLVLTIVGDLASSINKYGIMVNISALLALSIPTYVDMGILAAITLFAIMSIEIILLCETILSLEDEVYRMAAKLVEYLMLVMLLTVPAIYSYLLPFERKSVLVNPAIIYLTLWMKLFSFISFNRWCRICKSSPDASSSISNDILIYPTNLTRPNLYYFLMAPTLCYEITFPRNEYIRVRYLVKTCGELVFLVTLIIIISQQLVVPSLWLITHTFKSESYVLLFLEFIKLSVYVNIIWLIFFYSIFQCYLNITAEILRFGDRRFYHDWWNSSSLVYFWKTWNIPVHRWCKRHIYQPLSDEGYNRLQCTTAVFFLSAVFHEYSISSALSVTSFYMLVFFIAQIPLSLIVDTVSLPRVKNMVVWMCLITLQISGTILYYQEYYYAYGSEAIAFGVDVKKLKSLSH